MDVGQVVSPEAGGGVPDAGLSDARGADADRDLCPGYEAGELVR